MSDWFKKEGLVGRNHVRLVYAFLLLWSSFLAWKMAWPLTWGSVPIGLFWAYLFFRLVFEITFNRANIPTMATNYIARQKIAHLMQADAETRNLNPYHVLDLGSGRGELARNIAKTIPNAKVIGIEKARLPIWESSLIQKWFGPNNLSYQSGDFWSLDCSKADSVVVYLGPSSTQRIGEKLFKELKPGSMVITHVYPLGGAWVPVQELTYHAPFKEVIFVYKKETV